MYRYFDSSCLKNIAWIPNEALLLDWLHETATTMLKREIVVKASLDGLSETIVKEECGIIIPSTEVPMFWKIRKRDERAIRSLLFCKLKTKFIV